MDTPVAFIVFNRPDLTQQVFEAIRRAKPKRLLVVADGPRADRPAEPELCRQTRAVVEQVDWACQVERNYADTNLGCKKRVSSGLDWVFSRCESAIVLEDDCLPDDSLFPYCHELLNRYRDDERVMHVNGSNLVERRRSGVPSYFATKYANVWGWASWARAWRHYDVEMKGWHQFITSEQFRQLCPDTVERKFWELRLNLVADGGLDTWDYQWVLACWRNGGLSITPETNLISNLGFRADATHTQGVSNLAALPTTSIPVLSHPAGLQRDLEHEHVMFFEHHGGRDFHRNRQWRNRARSFMRRAASAVWRRLPFRTSVSSY